MNGTERVRKCLSDLPPEELERLARAHVDGMFSEICAVGTSLRASYDPLGFARRHPMAIAAVAGLLAGIFVRRGRRVAATRPPEGGGAPESPGTAFAPSLLSSLAAAAARALPELTTWWLSRCAASRQKGPNRP
jgi:hypothetical protein